MAGIPESDALVDLNNLLPVEHGGKDPKVKIHPSCRVCNAPNDLMKTVNYMLASGASYKDVERLIAPINASLPEGARIDYQGIRRHQKSHLPYDADAVRRILERRAEEAQQDFERGSNHLVGVAAYAEVMMKKGFASMANGEITVSPSEGLKAAEFLHRIEQESAGQDNAAETLATLNRIIQAVRAVVPERYWQRIMNHLDGEQEAIEAEAIEEDDEFDEDFEDDDEI